MEDTTESFKILSYMKRAVKDISFLQTFEYEGKLWYRGYEDEKFISCFTVKEDEKGYAKERMSLLKDTKVDVSYF